MGCGATSSKQIFMALLEQFPSLSSVHVAQAVALLSMKQGAPMQHEMPEVQQCFLSCMSTVRPDQVCRATRVGL